MPLFVFLRWAWQITLLVGIWYDKPWAFLFGFITSFIYMEVAMGATIVLDAQYRRVLEGIAQLREIMEEHRREVGRR